MLRNLEDERMRMVWARGGWWHRSTVPVSPGGRAEGGKGGLGRETPEEHQCLAEG